VRASPRQLTPAASSAHAAKLVKGALLAHRVEQR
jgi:hypothetical protein